VRSECHGCGLTNIMLFLYIQKTATLRKEGGKMNTCLIFIFNIQNPADTILTLVSYGFHFTLLKDLYLKYNN